MTISLLKSWDELSLEKQNELIAAHIDSGIPLDGLIYFSSETLAEAIIQTRGEVYGVDHQGCGSLLDSLGDLTVEWVCYAIPHS